MADIKYLIEVDATGAVKSVKNFDDTLEGLKKKSEGAEGAHKSLWKQVALGQFAYDAARKAGRLMVDLVRDSIQAAIEAADADNNLAAALASTGRTVEPLAEHYRAYAAELQKQTVYDDDAIKGAQALLLQLTRLDQEGMDQATKGAIGLASVFKMDLQSAATLVGKAMAGNTGVMSRYGITVDESLSPQEKQAALLEKLIGFYPRAQAETNTFGGSLKQLKNMWGEVQETAGGAIVQNETLQKAVKDLGEWVGKLAENDDFKLWLDTLIGLLVKAAEGVGKFAKGCKDLTEHVFGAVKADKEYKESLDKLNAARERAIAAGHLNVKMVKDMTEAAEKAAPAVNEVGVATGKGAGEDKKAAEAKKKLRDEIQAMIDRNTPLAASIRKVREDMEKADKAFKSGTIDAKTHKAAIAALKDEYARLIIPVSSADDALLKLAMTGKTDVVPALADIKFAGLDTFTSLEVQSQSFSEKATALFEQYGQAARTVIGSIDAIYQQSTNNKMILMDQEYQKKLETIQSSLMSEEEKNAAIEALDAEYDIKRKGLQRKAAEQQKAVAIASAIINVAEGVSKAIAQGGIFGAVFGAIVLALGAIQIAKIKATPIPLAEGAIFPQRALLQSMTTGRQYEVSERGEAEILASPRKLRQAILGGDRATSQAPKKLQLTIPIYIGTRKIQEEVIEIIEAGSQTGRLRHMSHRAFAGG